MTLEPLYDADEMRAAESRFPGFPGTAGELMERAGRAVAMELLRAYPDARRVGIVCGAGSNGGDGRIAASILSEQGLEAIETTEPEGFDVVVDALLGTGFRGSPRPEASALIERINAAGTPVVAVDIPSGVDASSGETPGTAVDADLTVTFHGAKVGHAVAPGRHRAGRVVVVDIGLEPIPTAVRRVQPDILARVPLRGAGDTKYSAGTVAIVGGAPGMTGAAVLAARAALRADAGYAVLCVPQDSLAVAETLALEPVKVGFAADEALARVVAATARAGAVAVGPGLGRDAGTRDLVRGLLERVAVPVVVDADGLFGLEPVERPHPTILTPHAGELARLLGVDADWVQAHRLEAARRAASGFGAVVVLKGPDTIVSAPDGTTLVSDLGPAALATAGTGDVLTGIVAAFLAKGLDATHAAAAAVVAHSLAARRTDRGSGLIASDLVDALSGVLCERPEPL